jgi:hypothetical protein
LDTVPIYDRSREAIQLFSRQSLHDVRE